MVWRDRIGRFALLVLLAAASASAQAATFVWRIGDTDNSVYLAGSMHMLPPKAYPLPAAFNRAFTAAKIVAFETDIVALQASPAQTKLLQAAQYQDGSGLDTHLDDALYAKVADALQAHGMRINALRSFKPWYVAAILDAQSFNAAGFKPKLGVDVKLSARARKAHKTIVPLESVAAHLALLTQMPPTMAKTYLRETAEKANDSRDDANTIYRYWRQGDAKGLADYVHKRATGDPALYNRLLFARNRSWLPKIRKLIDGNKDAMIVVGALHLVGPKGLIAKLRAAGYKVVQQ